MLEWIITPKDIVRFTVRNASHTLRLLCNPLARTRTLLRHGTVSHAWMFYGFNTIVLYLCNAPLMQRSQVSWMSPYQVLLYAIDCAIQALLFALILFASERVVFSSASYERSLRLSLYSFPLIYPLIPLFWILSYTVHSESHAFTPYVHPGYCLALAYGFIGFLYVFCSYGMLYDISITPLRAGLLVVLCMGFYYLLFFYVAIYTKLRPRSSFSRIFMHMLLVSLLAYLCFDALLIYKNEVGSAIWHTSKVNTYDHSVLAYISGLLRETLDKK